MPNKLSVPLLTGAPQISRMITPQEMYMEGLRSQVRTLEASLKPDQELQMICWHGLDKLRVFNVAMPSGNVVALSCRDANDDVVQVTGHLNAITFSFHVKSTPSPSTRSRIGFEMP